MAERVESEGFFEMLWDCDHCGAKGLLGKSQRYCAVCGGPQNPAKRYMPAPEQQKAAVGHKYVGADRTCPACHEPQSAAAQHCSHCGSPLDGAAEVAAAPLPAAEARPIARKRSPMRALLGVLIILGGLGTLIYMRCIRTREAKLTVTAHHWARAIAIEAQRDQTQTAWRDQLPSDARLVLCSRKQRSTKQIADGEDCHSERHDKKDGTFEQVKKCTTKYRSEPVDDDSCTYTVTRWTQVDQVKLEGDTLTPAWPPDPTLLGGRRIGAKTETLTLRFGPQSCDVSDAVWRKYSDGQKIKVEVRASSGDVVCGSL